MHMVFLIRRKTKNVIRRILIFQMLFQPRISIDPVETEIVIKVNKYCSEILLKNESKKYIQSIHIIKMLVG